MSEAMTLFTQALEQLRLAALNIPGLTKLATYPTDPRGALPGAAPLTRTRPLLTVTMPSSARMSVVLPEPLGPTRARACPTGTWPSTPVSTVEEP